MKINTKSKLIVIAILATTLVAASVLALTNPEIPRFFVGAGGQSTGGGYTLSGSIGQHDAGEVMSGGDYTMEGGFWVRLGGAIKDFFVHLPLVIK